MVHRMREKGLLEHLPYKGVRLTPKGESRALHVIRRHRIWERFLTDDLGLAWEEVHDSACRLEHAADRGVTEALAVHLGQPTTCPHGNPIPSQDASKHHAPGVQLDRLAIGDCGEILRVQQESREVLSFLGARGIKLGSRVQVTAINTYDGLWTVEIGGKEEVLGKTIASRLIIGNHLD
jgi:DtxR family Mn-dependent transcriptional regulator